MKKLAIIFLTIGVSVTAFGQKKKVNNATYLIQNYLDGYGSESLEKAKANIDEAVLDTLTGKQPNTWYIRGKVYQLVLTDSTMKTQYDQAADASISSFKKMSEFTDPKFKFPAEEAERVINELGRNIFNMGIDNYNTSKFKASNKYFAQVADVAAILQGKGLKSNFKAKDALENAVRAAIKGDEYVLAIEGQRKLIALAPTDTLYGDLVTLYRMNKDKPGARAAVEEGIAKYPTYKPLLIEKINVFIQDGKENEAIDYINKALEIDPKNDNLLLVLGNAYEKNKKLTEAKDAYLKAYESNPKNFDAVYNLGALLVTETNNLLVDINMLGISAADKKKDVELRAKRKEVASKAKEWFAKALAIDPDSQVAKDAMAKVDKIIAQ
jgi:tetratricopeptide (TPR) repeat protein